jgi:hypothetical protein
MGGFHVDRELCMRRSSGVNALLVLRNAKRPNCLNAGDALPCMECRRSLRDSSPSPLCLLAVAVGGRWTGGRRPTLPGSATATSAMASLGRCATRHFAPESCCHKRPHDPFPYPCTSRNNSMEHTLTLTLTLTFTYSIPAGAKPAGPVLPSLIPPPIC